MKLFKLFFITAILISLPSLLIAGGYTKTKAMSGSKDIVDTAVSAGSFNTLDSGPHSCRPGRHSARRRTLHRVRADG